MFVVFIHYIIGSNEDRDTFKDFANQMLTAKTENEYKIAHKQMEEFINKDTGRKEHVKFWFNWWHKRR